MEKTNKTISLNGKKYDVIKLHGHGFCWCRNCERNGKFGQHWTDWCYQLSEDSEILCYECLREKLNKM